MLHDRYPTEDDYFDAVSDAHAQADREAMAYAELSADLWLWDSEEEREAYIEAEYAAEYERLCEAYEKAL